MLFFLLFNFALAADPVTAVRTEFDINTTDEYSREMAATLLDMLAADRIGESFNEHLFISPEELAEVYAPQSAWGRGLVDAYGTEWNAALDKLISGLRGRGELDQALQPQGLRFPFTRKLFEAAPEYLAIEGLIQSITGNVCNNGDEPLQCYVLINLVQKPGGQIALTNIRIVDSNGSLIAIPGIIQR